MWSTKPGELDELEQAVGAVSTGIKEASAGGRRCIFVLTIPVVTIAARGEINRMKATAEGGGVGMLGRMPL